jgi:hypothetical protein
VLYFRLRQLSQADVLEETTPLPSEEELLTGPFGLDVVPGGIYEQIQKEMVAVKAEVRVSPPAQHTPCSMLPPRADGKLLVVPAWALPAPVSDSYNPPVQEPKSPKTSPPQLRPVVPVGTGSTTASHQPCESQPQPK